MGNGTPLQYFCPENPMDGGAWWAAVRRIGKSRTRLSDFTFTFHFHPLEKEMATHSSVLAWRIPESDTTEATQQKQHVSFQAMGLSLSSRAYYHFNCLFKYFIFISYHSQNPHQHVLIVHLYSVYFREMKLFFFTIIFSSSKQ